MKSVFVWSSVRLYPGTVVSILRVILRPRSFYNECIRFFKELDASISEKDILVIGDSLETDIKGACKNNLSSVLVAGGIHAELFNRKLNNNSIKKIQTLCKNKSEYPDFLINKFIF